MSLLVIPGEAEAIERENFVRQAAFLDVPETVCGLPVAPLTLRHLAILDAIGSPFMCGGVPTPADVGAVLWVLSPDYSPRSKWKRSARLRKCRSLNYGQAVAELDGYFAESFQDAPGGSGVESKSYYAFTVAIIDIIAHEYGWSRTAILDLKLKEAFQYLKAITHRNNPKAIMFNPSDKVRGEWLRKRNKERPNDGN